MNTLRRLLYAKQILYRKAFCLYHSQSYAVGADGTGDIYLQASQILQGNIYRHRCKDDSPENEKYFDLSLRLLITVCNVFYVFYFGVQKADRLMVTLQVFAGSTVGFTSKYMQERHQRLKHEVF